MKKFLSLFMSDLQASYGSSSKIKKFSAIITNSSIHACFFIRCAQCSHSAFHWIFRRILISCHSIEYGRGAQIGPGLILPHPINIVFGMGCVIGSNCTIFHGVTIGQSRAKYPTIGSNVVIYPNCFVVGDVVIEDEKILKPFSFVSSSRTSSVVDN